jgi:hypothetical protein
VVAAQWGQYPLRGGCIGVPPLERRTPRGLTGWLLTAGLGSPETASTSELARSLV